MLGWIQTIVISILESVFGITPGGSPIPSSYLDTDGTLAANSDTKIATQKAVKTYADQLIASADAMIFKGVIDCSANPNYPAADRGHTYRVSVAGKIGGASGPNVENGDLLMCMTDGTPSGTQAAVGAQWAISQTNIDGALISGGPLGTPSSGVATNLTGTASGLTAGNATTAATLATPRAINGVNFDGSAPITVTAAASTLTGTSLASGVTGSSLTSFGTSPTLTGTPTATTAAGGTNTTQIATTAFVTDAVGTAVTGLLEFKGSTDCSSNPNYPAASKGDSYLVSVAGKIGGASGTSVDVGDMYVAIADNAGGTQASVGTSWTVLEHNLAGALLSANNLSDIANAGTARTNLGLGTANNPTFATLELGNATDTTLSRSAAGKIAVEGKAVPLMNGSIDAIFAGPTATRTYTFPDADTTFGAAASGANPFASVGLTTVNGSASTFLRSDGAPALDVTITPTWSGIHTFTPIARSSGSAAYLTINAPADTALTASTEAIGVNVVGATRQHATGALATQREYVFGSPTYSAVGATTITKAATLAVAAAPTAGTNVTLTNAYAFWIQAGLSQFDAQVFISDAAAEYAMEVRNTNSGAASSYGMRLRAGNDSSDVVVTFENRAGTTCLLIQGNGNVIIHPAQLTTNATAGFLYIPQCAGTPTGTPSSGSGGSSIPLVFDASGAILYLYTAGSWKKAAASLVTGAITWQ